MCEWFMRKRTKQKNTTWRWVSVIKKVNLESFLLSLFCVFRLCFLLRCLSWVLCAICSYYLAFFCYFVSTGKNREGNTKQSWKRLLLKCVVDSFSFPSLGAHFREVGNLFFSAFLAARDFFVIIFLWNVFMLRHVWKKVLRTSFELHLFINFCATRKLLKQIKIFAVSSTSLTVETENKNTFNIDFANINFILSFFLCFFADIIKASPNF